MYESFGAAVTGRSVAFQLFFPDNTVDPSQYVRGGLPQISSLQVTGNFQSKTGGTDWDYQHGPALTKAPHPNGWLYSFQIDGLPDGFYEYKYFVTFDNGTSRWCSDPCSKYGGFENENSGFVVGGHKTTVKPIQKRLPQGELVIYEVMLDDFTRGYRNKKAPFDAFRDKLDYLQSLGVNAVEFMPWATWPSGEFSWGYDPVSFFSVEYNYYNDDSEPLDKLYKVKGMINDMHSRGMHVIMDGVFNHANDEGDPNKGFAYKWLYQDPADSPYIGVFGEAAFFSDLDFCNNCTDDFINDVCRYWIDVFCIDGIRFDYVLGYYVATDPNQGIGELIASLDQYCKAKGLGNMSFMLELLTDPSRYEAIADTNNIEASGCWYDPIMFEMINGAGQLDGQVMRALNAGEGFSPDKRPVTYIENHDHSTLTSQCGGRANWFVTQPMAIALFTICGTTFIHNGQEFGQEYWMPGNGNGRVVSRPVDWGLATESIGKELQWLYQKLIAIRKAHPALGSQNFYPDAYDFSWGSFNAQGYGVDIANGIIIYHRWGNDANGKLERFIIALNFSASDRTINIPFPENGNWQNLLTDTEEILAVNNYWVTSYTLQSHWGKIFMMA